MKKIVLLSLVLVSICFTACVSNKPVSRISATKQKDLSGNWNDNDIRIVCESIIDECIKSSQVKRFIKQKNRLPYVKLGTIFNF